MNLESIVIHTDIKEKLQWLTDEEAGRLFKAIVAYAESGTILSPDADKALGLVFLFVKDQIDRDYEKYQARVKANRENGSKGGRPHKSKEPNKPTETDGLSEKPNKTDGLFTEPTETLPNPIPNPIPNPKPKSIPTDSEGKAKRFIKPTLQEIEDYIKEMGYDDDPGAIYDHYEANGWKQSGGNGIKDWKAAVRNWHRRSGSFGQAPQTRELSFKSDKGDNPAKEDYEKKDYSMRFGTTTTKEKKNWGERF